MPLSEWAKLFELSDRFGFVIASDECYSEIYFRDEPPLGGLEAAAELAFTEVGGGGEAADGERAAGMDEGAGGLDDGEIRGVRGEGADGAFENGPVCFGRGGR